MRKLLLILVTATLNLNLPAQAQDSRAKLENDFLGLPRNWKPFFGFSTGYMSPGGEVRTEGVPASVKLLASYESEERDWVADAGLGIQYQVMNHLQNSLAPITELSWRYRWASGWQAGPLMNTLIGESDRYGSANSNVTSFIGATVLKEFRTSGYQWRAGLSAMTDIDIRNEKVDSVMAHIQVTFGESEKVASAPTQAPAADHPADHLIEHAKQELMGHGSTTFAVNQSKLTSSGKAYLDRLVVLLKDPKNKIQKIAVIGHTDSTGTERLNSRLSLDRAKAVSAYLISKGVPTQKLERIGRSSLEPISTDLAPNRRAQVKILKAANLSDIESRLESIR